MATREVWGSLSRRGPTVGLTGSMHRLILRVMCGVGMQSQRWLLLERQELNEIQKKMAIVGASAGADEDCGKVAVAQSEKFWADVGGSSPDLTCIVDDGGADRGELASGGMRSTGATTTSTAVPVSEVGPHPEAVLGGGSVDMFGFGATCFWAQECGGYGCTHTEHTLQPSEDTGAKGACSGWVQAWLHIFLFIPHPLPHLAAL